MKILLVDDSKIMRTIQKRILAALGDVEFVEAEDGVHAMSIIEQTVGGFNLILVDWNMPRMDGLTLVQTIRSTDKKTPMLMVTTEAQKCSVMTALKAGVNNYAFKPFTPEMLLGKVRHVLCQPV